MRTKKVLGQPSWTMQSNKVTACLTQLGGHLAPVSFQLVTGAVAPFAVAPWAQERLPANTPGLIRALRGDFFCLPFGANSIPWSGEQHPPHGETANSRWSLQSFKRAVDSTELCASLQSTVRQGEVIKHIKLLKDHTALYLRHTLRGFSGKLSVGHHALLQCPSVAGSGVIRSSAFLQGQVFPGEFEQPAQGGYQALKAGTVFRRLQKVSASNGESVDISHYPARAGFDDLVMLCTAGKQKLAWNIVTFPKQRYAWFALRDPRLLAHTLLWFSNGGRHYAPWNGRHRGVLGIEDVTSYFHLGLAQSVAPNPVNRRGWPTSIACHAARDTEVNYIMGVAALPRDFGVVEHLEPAKNGVDLFNAKNKKIQVELNLQHLYGAQVS
jgi:hypothetical protein